MDDQKPSFTWKMSPDDTITILPDKVRSDTRWVRRSHDDAHIAAVPRPSPFSDLSAIQPTPQGTYAFEIDPATQKQTGNKFWIPGPLLQRINEAFVKAKDGEEG